MFVRILLLYSAIWSFTFSVLGENSFDAAMRQVGQKNFSSALSNFKSALEKDSLNPSLHFNLGKCYAELNLYPDAIYHFEKVLKIDPLDNEAEASIQYCYEKLNNGTTWKPGMSAMERFVYSIKPKTWGICAILSSILSGFFIFLFLIRKGNISRSLAMLSFVGFLCTSFFLLAEHHTSNHLTCTNQAINLKQTTQTYSATGTKLNQYLPIGSKVIRIRAIGEFSLVELMNGERIRILTNAVKWI